MKRREPRLEPELAALLAPGKIERHAPPDVRARALARARTIVAAGGRVPPATVLQFPTLIVARRPAPVWFPLAASLAVAAAAAAPLTLRNSHAHLPFIVSPPTARPPRIVPDQHPEGDARVQPQPLAPAAEPPGLAHTARTVHEGRSLSAELDLLSRAQAAYTRGDFSQALSLLAEQAREFPNGHLAEEREALRVRSLMRSGRTDESHRAAAAFTQRFPRSALLAHVQEGSESQKATR